MLAEKGASAGEVGYMVGFKNRSHFSQAFKKRYGCAPNNYLKLSVGNQTC
ncbi:helix-turn-helix domain-containing protein [Paraprevotella clara]